MVVAKDICNPFRVAGRVSRNDDSLMAFNGNRASNRKVRNVLTLGSSFRSVRASGLGAEAAIC
jgi:hypothetical protein